jgi:MarR-like DNA-binding transcriptional regulator SgrR of sgrS sRNA
MMEEALKSGQQHNALELAQLALKICGAAAPFLGGQWQNDTPTLRIPYYRSLEPLQPAFYRAGQSSIWRASVLRADAF